MGRGVFFLLQSQDVGENSPSLCSLELETAVVVARQTSLLAALADLYAQFLA